jgi:hypothetical protein
MNARADLTRRILDYLGERLELLHESLRELGRRLRDGIAQVVSRHAGDALRELLSDALHRTDPDADDPSYHSRSYYEDDPYGGPADYWHEYGPEQPLPQSSHRVPSVTERVRRSRWWALLPSLLHLLGGARFALDRRAWLALAGIGAGAGLLTLILGPSAGAVWAVAGSVLLLTGLADSVRDGVGFLLRLLHR